MARPVQIRPDRGYQFPGSQGVSRCARADHAYGFTIESLRDLAVSAEADRPTVGVIQGSPSAVAVNEQSQVVDAQLVSENSGLRLRPRINRYRHCP